MGNRPFFPSGPGYPMAKRLPLSLLLCTWLTRAQRQLQDRNCKFASASCVEIVWRQLTKLSYLNIYATTYLSAASKRSLRFLGLHTRHRDWSGACGVFRLTCRDFPVFLAPGGSSQVRRESERERQKGAAKGAIANTGNVGNMKYPIGWSLSYSLRLNISCYCPSLVFLRSTLHGYAAFRRQGHSSSICLFLEVIYLRPYSFLSLILVSEDRT